MSVRDQSSFSHHSRVAVSALLLFGLSPAVCSGAGTQEHTNVVHRRAGKSGLSPAKNFDAAADEALLAMRRRAAELKIGGVAVVAYFEGERIEGWVSKMAVVGRMKDEPAAGGKGSNLLAIAYAKASEMADTLKDSGSQVRPPLTGEFGWSGGVIVRGEKGYFIAAFSGGKSEDDVSVSRVGVDVIKARF